MVCAYRSIMHYSCIFNGIYLLRSVVLVTLVSSQLVASSDELLFFFW